MNAATGTDDPWAPEQLSDLFARAARGEQIPSAGIEAPSYEKTLSGMRSLRDRGWDLVQRPPPKEWTFIRERIGPDDSPGVFRRGIVGMLAGPAGQGKSTLVLGLAVSAASGCEFLGWRPLAPGRVLYISTEDPETIVHERLFDLWPTLAKQPRARAHDLLDNLVVWAPRGEDLAMVKGERDGFAVTDFAMALRAKIAAGGYSLVIVDPLTRVAGPDTETSNSAGTALVRELEALTLDGTSVLINHHTRKGAPGQSPRDMDAARGSSSLSGGVKLQINIDPILDESGQRWGLAVVCAKSNYARHFPDVITKWGSGFLREASDDEIAEREERVKAKAEEQADATRAKSRERGAETRAKAKAAKVQADAAIDADGEDEYR